MILIVKNNTDDIEKKVSEFEKQLNVVLPEQYRKFLLRYNGGDAGDTNFKIKGEGSDDLRNFYGIGDVECSFSEIDPDDLKDIIKNGILPIAEDYYGNYISIGITEENNGVIFFCDHEKNLRYKKLADGFGKFVDICKCKKVNPLLGTPIEEREKKMVSKGYAERINDGLRRMWQNEINHYEKLKTQVELIVD